MRVRIARRCHCVIKNNIASVYTYETVEEARAEATKILHRLETKNCKAHIFFIREEVDEVVIDSKFNIGDISI